jgi:hypothetical protein
MDVKFVPSKLCDQALVWMDVKVLPSKLCGRALVWMDVKFCLLHCSAAERLFGWM